MTVTVFSKDNCVACNQTKKFLDRNGLPYNTIDITQDQAAYDKVINMGFMAAPVVMVNNQGEETAWSGYQPEKLKELTERV